MFNLFKSGVLVLWLLAFGLELVCTESEFRNDDDDEIVESTSKSVLDLTAEEYRASPAHVDSLHQIYSDIETLLRIIIQNFTLYIPDITSDMNKIAARMLSSLDGLSHNMLENGESVLHEVVQNMKRQLFKEFHHIAHFAGNQFNLVVDHLNDTLINKTESIDAWASNLKKELRTMNNSHLYKEGCLVVDDFLEQSTDELQTCCDIVVKPMRSLCRDMRDSFTESFQDLVDVLDRMQICLEDKMSYLEYMKPCLDIAYDNLNALLARGAKLRHNFSAMLPVKIMFSKSCLSIVSVQMEYRQHKVEQTIEAKIGESRRNIY